MLLILLLLLTLLLAAITIALSLAGSRASSRRVHRHIVAASLRYTLGRLVCTSSVVSFSSSNLETCFAKPKTKRLRQIFDAVHKNIASLHCHQYPAPHGTAPLSDTALTKGFGLDDGEIAT